MRRPRISLICLVLLIATKRQDNFFSTAATRFHRRLHFFRRGLKNYYSMLNCSNEGMSLFDTRSRQQLCLAKLGVLVSLNSRIMYERFERALLEKSSSDSFFVQCHKPSFTQSYQACLSTKTKTKTKGLVCSSQARTNKNFHSLFHFRLRLGTWIDYFYLMVFKIFVHPALVEIKVCENYKKKTNDSHR